MTQQELENEVQQLKGRLDAFERSDRFTISKLFQLLDGRNIQLGRANGTMIGTAIDQKLSFYGKSPVAQQSGISAPSSAGATYSQSQVQGLVDAVSALISRLRTIGITS